MRIFVTGGAGFIGRNLVESFLDKNIVSIYDDLSNSSEDKISSLVERGVKFIRGDILDYKKLLEASKEFDAVIHLAAKSDVEYSTLHPKITNEVNVTGTLNVLRACVENKISKIIFASSAAVYGDFEIPISEDIKMTPLSPYGKSKLEAEKNMEMFAKKNNLNCISLRMFNVYGYDQKDGVIPKFVNNILKEKPIIIFGDGTQTRDFISICDVIDAFYCALDKIDEKKGEIYNIANGKAISINVLAELFQTVLGKKLEIKFEGEKKDEIKHSVADISKAKRDLGFCAKKKLGDEIVEILGSVSH